MTSLIAAIPRLRWTTASTTRGAIFMATSLLLVVVANALARDLTSRYPANEVLFFRFFCALPLVLACSGKLEVRDLATRRLPLHALRAMLVVGATLALYLASQHLLFADLIAISYSTPLFVGIFAAPLLGERVGGGRALLTIIGFVGVLLVACPGRLELWSAGALTMAVLNAFAVLTARSLAKTEDPAQMAIHFTLFGLVFSALLIPYQWVAPSPEDLLSLGALGLAAGLAIHVHAHAFRCAPASFLAPIDYFGVVISAGLGLLLWSEIPSIFTFAGGGLIVLVGMLHVWIGARRAEPVSPPPPDAAAAAQRA
jgi:drug/metabolite transporter (DMT)-like permease